MPASHQKRCDECGTIITGRLSKRFCSDHCRNTYHNRLNSDVTNYIRNTNNALRKNRRILMELNTLGKTKVSRTRLADRGFDFRHFTSTYTTKEGALYYFCYDQGYLPIEKGNLLLVVKNEF